MSGLGYPLSDEADDPTVPLGRMNQFEQGSLHFDHASGVTAFFDENQPIIPQVVIKIVDAVPLGLDRGMTLSLDELAAAVGLFAGNPILEAVRIVLPNLDFITTLCEVIRMVTNTSSMGANSRRFVDTIQLDFGNACNFLGSVDSGKQKL